MRNAGLDEAQARIKIAGRNINNLRYADDAALVEKKWRTKEPLHEKERGEWRSCLKTQHSKNLKNMASVPTTSWPVDGETVETVPTLLLGASKSLQTVTAAMKLKDTCSLEEKLWSI